MNPDQMSMRDVMLYALLVNAGIGLALGLVPLIIGFVKGKVRYGILGMIVSVIGGAILGVILSIPAVIIFTWLILGRTKADDGDAGTGPSETASS
jgi:hypothetical protein